MMETFLSNCPRPSNAFCWCYTSWLAVAFASCGEPHQNRASTLVAYGGREERADFGTRAQEARRSASGCPPSSDYWLPRCSVFSQGSGANLHPFSLGADVCSSKVAGETLVSLHATQGSCPPAANSTKAKSLVAQKQCFSCRFESTFLTILEPSSWLR